jgi:diguanylate cyclase (GGDEF)-like protein/PAS domain S-box-containing protein
MSAHLAESPIAEHLLDLFVDSVVDHAILMLDVDGNVATWNAGAERFKGYRAEEIVGRHFSIFYPPADIAAGKPARELQVAATEGSSEDEGWRVRRDGTQFWANVVITALRDPDGTLRGYGKITRDLSERRKADLALRASEERFRLMIEAVEDYAIFMLDLEGRVATWNAGAQRFKGYRAAEIIGRHFSTFYPPEDVAAGKPAHELTVAAAEGHLVDEGWRVRQDGSQFWANVLITAMRDVDGQLRGYCKITRDLTESRLHERQLEHMADHDPLTGASNRRSFGRELNGHVVRVARYGANGAVLMIDLDNFKQFNDSQGHRAGDQLIVRIARGLQSRLRDSDVFARLGGDEFAVLLPFADERSTEIVAEALLQVVRDLSISGRIGVPNQVTASVGIALFTDGESLSADEMIANADVAMYDAKEAGRNRWARYRTV